MKANEPRRRVADRRLAQLAERYCDALRSADRAAAEAIVAEALADGTAPTAVQVDVIQVGMRRVGALWEQGDMTVADEHMATVLSHEVLLQLYEVMQVAPPGTREQVVLSAVQGQTHVLGLRMIADVLEGAGFDVLYLGADVPPGALRDFVSLHRPAVVGLSSTLVADAPLLADAIVAVHEASPSCRIMLGGAGVPIAWHDIGYPWVADATVVLAAVEGLLAGPPQSLPPLLDRLQSRAVTTAPSASGSDEREQPVVVADDMSEVARGYARRAAEYRYLAYRDPVTSLPNRRAFDDRIIALGASSEEHALLVIDVDKFKAVNDEEGHDAGDVLLRRVGQAIRGAVREGDALARIGGDEFAVLLPACGQPEAGTVAEQVRAAVQEETHGAVTVSIGIAALGSDTRGAVLEADRALYAAKADGRNRACTVSA